MTHFWIRAEQRAYEKRVGLTPLGARELMSAGHKVTIEMSSDRIIPIDQYQDVGCNIADANAWKKAPNDAAIFGLKEILGDHPLHHRHIMFGHAFKGQDGAEALLSRFKLGGGSLFDLEYLLDQQKRRVAAFGYWAGYAGAAIGVLTWIAQQNGDVLGPIEPYDNQALMLLDLKQKLSNVTIVGKRMPSVIVVGALGRAGRGATDLCEALGLAVTKWDVPETKDRTSFPEILEHELFINCVLAMPGVPVFVSKSDIGVQRQLSVISDVSCDPDSTFNPIPIYDYATNFADPVIHLENENYPLDVTAIDNLPSVLPLESSIDFADQLLPYLIRFDENSENVWVGAKQIFDQHIKELS